MAELVHDLAPGSPLLFNTAFTGEAGFAAGIDALRACGAKVIVDDITYYQEPMFQDGIIAQAAQAALTASDKEPVSRTALSKIPLACSNS